MPDRPSSINKRETDLIAWEGEEDEEEEDEEEEDEEGERRQCNPECGQSLLINTHPKPYLLS